MQIQKIDNINFNGFKFQNTYAKEVFENKLKFPDKKTAASIKKYMKHSKTEPADVMINATKTRTLAGDHILFATFSNSENLVVELSRSPRRTRLQEFIARCGEKAGYEPMYQPQNLDDASKLLDLADLTLNTIKSKI